MELLKEKIQAGMLAWSRAGHDQGKLYVISEIDNGFVYLTDGELKPLEKPKKKKVIHIQVIKRIPEELQSIADGTVKNEDIRKVIRRFLDV